MSDEDEETDTIEVRHEKSDSFELIPATGVHGGIQPQGNFQFNLTIDHNPEALVDKYLQTEDGHAVKSETDYEDYSVREHLIGVTMSRQDAFSAGCWIIANSIGNEFTEEDIKQIIVEEYDLPTEAKVVTEENESTEE
jgi:hypothetical protein